MNIQVRRGLLLLAATASILSGCGGGGEGRRANVEVLPEELLTPPCPSCQPASIQGIVATGLPIAHAEVMVIDSVGAQRSTTTNGNGHYVIAVQGMAAPFVVLATGLLNGRAHTLHTVVLPTEVGRALSNITPLTELLTAQVLQGIPHDLLQDGQVDFQRINSRAVRSAQAELERLVRPLLEAAGVPPLTDFRGAPFQADHTGMDLALDGLVLTQEQGAYRLRHVLNPPSDALTIDPAGASSTEPLRSPPSMSVLKGLSGITGQINGRLAALTGLFANGIAGNAELQPHLGADFLSDGLSGPAYLSKVWRRLDAAVAGGFSLQGAQWSGATILQMQDESNVLVALHVSPRAPFSAYTEVTWMEKVAGQWQWRGNRQLAKVGARHASVLGSDPFSGSAEVASYLVFEVDRLRVDPRVAQMVVRGPGLPGAGVSLAPPPDEDVSSRTWTWAGRRGDDWPAVPRGWCPDTGDALLACQESWAEVRTGSSYQFTLLDDRGETLQTLWASLPPKPATPEVLAAGAGRWFARFAATQDDLSWLPTPDNVTGRSPYRGDSPLLPRWRATSAGWQSVEALFELYVATPATASSDLTFSVQSVWQSVGQVSPGSFSQLSGVWTPLASAQLPKWAVLRLATHDMAGNLYIHALSPRSPQ